MLLFYSPNQPINDSRVDKTGTEMWSTEWMDDCSKKEKVVSQIWQCTWC